MMTNRLFIISLVSPLLLSGCVHQSASVSAEKHEKVELALLMKNVNYFTQKLGLAIQSNNANLANFYIHEVEEGLEEIYSVSSYDNLPIGQTAKKIMPAAFGELEKAIDSKDQDEMLQSYQSVIESCNRCHNATQHGYLKILVPTTNPFNQNFAP